ncbi:MAG: hypothetical protein V1857_03465 [archaeon]
MIDRVSPFCEFRYRPYGLLLPPDLLDGLFMPPRKIRVIYRGTWISLKGRNT